MEQKRAVTLLSRQVISLTDKLAEKDLKQLAYEAALAEVKQVKLDNSSKETLSVRVTELEESAAFLRRENQAKMEVI